MKKTFMAMLLVGGTLSMFAQNTQTGSTTTNPQTTTGTPQQSTSTTAEPTNTTGNNTSTMNSTDTVPGATTNPTTTNPTTTNPATTANGSWNGVSASTSWTPETAPAYSWNNYGNWQNMGSVYPTANGNLNTNTNMNGVAANNGTMSSTGSYSAYGGTAVASLPANVQMRFSQDFPTGANNQYSWNQYGDWFHTHYVNNGRLWQYFYSQRGDGYALVLPVLHSYVPENIINNAIQKYGSSLYSISMVKTQGDSNTYQVGLIQGGQLNMQYLDENGATVNDVWRTEDSTSMDSTQSNAAMGSSSTSGNWSSDASSSQQSSMSTDMNSNAGDMNNQSSDKGKSKLKIKHADGSETKIKTKDGQTKVKTNPATNNSNDQQ